LVFIFYEKSAHITRQNTVFAKLELR